MFLDGVDQGVRCAVPANPKIGPLIVGNRARFAERHRFAFGRPCLPPGNDRKVNATIQAVHGVAPARVVLLCGGVMALLAAPARAADPMLASAKDCGLPGVPMNCRLWQPAAVKPGQKYPLIIYLHGAGQAGYSTDPKENEARIENTRNWAAKLLAVVNEDTGKTNGDYFVMLPQAPFLPTFRARVR